MVLVLYTTAKAAIEAEANKARTAKAKKDYGLEGKDLGLVGLLFPQTLMALDKAIKDKDTAKIKELQDRINSSYALRKQKGEEVKKDLDKKAELGKLRSSVIAWSKLIQKTYNMYK